MTSSWLSRISLMINFFLLVNLFIFKVILEVSHLLEVRKTIVKIARFLYLIFSCIAKM